MKRADDIIALKVSILSLSWIHFETKLLTAMEISGDSYEMNAFLNDEIEYDLKLTLAEQMKYRRNWRTNILLDDQLTVLRLCAILQVLDLSGSFR